MRESRQHLFGVATGGQLAARLVQQQVALVERAVAQRLQRLAGGVQVEPALERLGLAVDDALGLGQRLGALAVAVLGDLAQVVDGVEIGVAQPADVRLDVAGHGQVEHEHRLLAASAQRGPHRVAGHQRHRAGGAGDDDVVIRQFVVQPVQADGARLELFGHGGGAVRTAVADRQRLHALTAEMTGAILDHLAGADHQRRQLLDLAEDLVGELERGERQRDRVVADARFRAHQLGGLERMLEQAVENGAQGVVVLRALPGGLDLSDHLRFAQHHGIHARGHLEQVRDGLPLLEGEQVALEFAVARAVPGVDPVGQRARPGAVAAGVEFGTIAGAYNGALVDAIGRAHRFESLAEPFRRERQPLADFNRRGSMTQSKGENRHEGTTIG